MIASVGRTETVSVRQELLTGMREAADEIIDTALERLLELPVYRRLPVGDERDVREFSSWLFHVFLACLDEDRGLSMAETAHLAAVGRSRSERGIDVDGFTAAFEIVYDRSHARLAELATGMADPAATAVLGQLSRALGSLSRAAVLAVATGLDDAPAPTGDREPRNANAVLQTLVDGVGDRALLTETARGVLGIAAGDALHIVIAVPGVERSKDLRVMLGLDGDRGLELLASTARQRPVNHVVGLVAARGGEPLAAALPLRDVGHTLLTQRLEAAHDLGPQYTDVCPHLHMAQHLAAGGVVSLADLRMFAEIGSADLSIVEAFVRSRLGDVLAQEREQAEMMLATIGAYLESGGSHKLTGERLHLHPKTIATRIRKIRRGTTVDLNGGVRAMLTLLAVKVLDVRGSDLPAIGDERWGD